MHTRLLASFCVLLTVLSISSCERGEITYDFKGRVMNSPGFSGVSGVDIELRQVIFNSNVTNFNYQFAGSATSDASGDWEISIPREKVTDFSLSIDKDGYFDQTLEFTSGEVVVDEPNVFNSILEAEAWIKFDIENIGPDAGDEMVMTLINFREGCEGCTTNGNYYFGEIVDTVMVIKTTGSKYTRFQFNDQTTASLISDSLLTIPQDTVSYTFHY